MESVNAQVEFAGRKDDFSSVVGNSVFVESMSLTPVTWMRKLDRPIASYAPFMIRRISRTNIDRLVLETHTTAKPLSVLIVHLNPGSRGYLVRMIYQVADAD